MRCRHCTCPVVQDFTWWFHDCEHASHNHPAEPDKRIGSQEGETT